MIGVLLDQVVLIAILVVLFAAGVAALLLELERIEARLHQRRRGGFIR